MRTPRGTIILSCIIFVALGILSAGIGPVLPDLAANTASTLETVGSIFTAIFLGAFLAQIVSGTLADRLGPRPVVITGMLIFSAGMLGVSFSRSLPVMLASALFAGLGHGAMDISVNILVARVFQDRSVAAVNLVNFFFGLGAVAGPAIASYTINQWNTGIPVLWIGVGMFLITTPFVVIFLMSPREKPNTTIQASESPYFLSPLLWLAGLILFLYVGAESSMGGWTATYMQQTTSLNLGRSALVVSGFWMALTIGRLVASVLGSRWGALRLLTTCLIGASAGGLMLALTTGAMLPTIIAVLLIGFFFGPIFPTTFSISASQFSQSSGKATGLIVALASLGGMSLPAIQGIVLTRFGNNPSVWLIAFYTLAMVLINFGRNRLVRKQNSQPPMVVRVKPIK
jgi:fucose permease